MTAWLGQLSIARKFQLIVVIGVLAIGTPAFLELRADWGAYQAATAEGNGVEPAELALHAMHYMLESRGLSQLMDADAGGSRAQSEAAKKEVTGALDALGGVLDRHAQFGRAREQLADVRATWQAAMADSTSPDEFARFSAAHAALSGVLDAIRDEAGFPYTPHADAYHLQLAVLSLAPEAESAVALLRGIGTRALTTRDAEGAESGAAEGLLRALPVLAEIVMQQQANYERELAKFLAIHPEGRKRLEAEFRRTESAVDEAIALASAVASGQAIAPADWFAKLSVALRAQHEFNDLAIESLALIAEANASNARRTLLGLFSALLILATSGALIVWGVASSVIQSTRRAVAGAQRIAELQLDNRLDSRDSDELGQLMRALGKMQADLKARIETERRVAEENTRVRASLDVASAGVMIADSEGIVVYMNKAVERTLRDAEADLRGYLPHFAVDKVVGTSFDQWHKEPGKQRHLIGQLRSTHAARIKVGKRSFELFATPVEGADGKRIGTALEWLDRTAESDFRHGLRNVVQRAASGFLDARVNATMSDERFVELATIVNGLIGTTEKAVAEVETVMTALADGNLSVRSSAQLLGRFGELNDNANRTAVALTEVIGEIKKVVAEINAASAEIANGNADLSRRTEQAAASIEETAAALHEVNTMVSHSAASANEAKNLASRAAESAAQGGEVVKGVVTTMQSIRDSSKQMSEIISVIDGIAFQTNILALNAAVEAARAGEQGRGFAVVASEVRSLAQRAADAAKQIAGLIRDAEQRVEGGSALVQQAGERMDSIVGSARQVADLVADIAAGAAEQAKGIGEVNAAVEQLDQTTQANAALVEEMAASAQALSQQAVALNAVSERFVIRAT